MILHLFLYPAAAAAGRDHGREGGHEIVEAGGVHLKCLGHLSEVADAGGGARTFTRALKGGQQHGRQNRNDADDDQQLNQGKCVLALFHFVLAFRLVLFYGMYCLIVVSHGYGFPNAGKVQHYILYRIS